MEATITVEERITEIIRSLPLVKQKEVLNFAEFVYTQTNPEQFLPSEPISVLELAGELIGCLEIGGDLSLKKHELKSQV
jgi:hypothetical protein